MNGGAWWAAVHGVAKNQTQLSDFTFIFHFHALEKEMATHSSVLAWRIPGMGEPGGPPSMGSHRVRHNWSDLAAEAANLPYLFREWFMLLFKSLVRKFESKNCSRKTPISALLTMPKPSIVWITMQCGKFLKRWEYQTTWPASWENYMQVKKQQLELDMEQQTGAK